MLQYFLSEWHWWDQTYLVIALNTGLWVLVTLLTRPDRPEVLDRFYRKGRPLGVWGPVRARVESEAEETETNISNRSTSGVSLIAAGLVLALVGAASVM